MLKKLSQKLGFTSTEIKVLIFVIAVFTVGFGAKLFFKSKSVKPKVFNYSEEDSLFAAADSLDKREENKAGLETEFADKNIDYKREVLDFNKKNFEGNKEKVLPAEKSIDLNSADINVLVTLPGIGEKSAQNIIDYRTSNGNFKKLEELLDVKQIGDSKFKKIKKYLFIKK